MFTEFFLLSCCAHNTSHATDNLLGPQNHLPSQKHDTRLLPHQHQQPTNTRINRHAKAAKTNRRPEVKIDEGCRANQQLEHQHQQQQQQQQGHEQQLQLGGYACLPRIVALQLQHQQIQLQHQYHHTTITTTAYQNQNSNFNSTAATTAARRLEIHVTEGYHARLTNENMFNYHT